MSEITGSGELWVADDAFAPAFRKLVKQLKKQGLMILEFEETERVQKVKRHWERLHNVRWGLK